MLEDMLLKPNLKTVCICELCIFLTEASTNGKIRIVHDVTLNLHSISVFRSLYHPLTHLTNLCMKWPDQMITSCEGESAFQRH